MKKTGLTRCLVLLMVASHREQNHGTRNSYSWLATATSREWKNTVKRYGAQIRRGKSIKCHLPSGSMPTHRKRSSVPNLSIIACPGIHWTPDRVKLLTGFWRIYVWNLKKQKEKGKKKKKHEKLSNFFVLPKRDFCNTEKTIEMLW